MGATEETLELLNHQTFEAEAKKTITTGERVEEWEPFLRRVLADDFRIRRADRSRPIEDGEAMIRTTAGREPQEREISDVEAVAFEDRGYGMVTCIARVGGKDYHNVKLFHREPSGSWRCAYWHVTPLAAR